MKVAIDTNILLRLLVADNKILLEKATSLISKYSFKEIYISSTVILEIFYVLKSVYEWPIDKILDAIESILNSEEFSVDDEIAIRLALVKARKKQPFYDSFIGETGALKNLKTYTFDKKFKNDKSFIVI